jgi:hypothetical protein
MSKDEGPHKVTVAAAYVVGAASGLGGAVLAVRKAGWKIKLPFGAGYVIGRVRQYFGSSFGDGNDADADAHDHAEHDESADTTGDQSVIELDEAPDEIRLEDLSRDELYARAQELDIQGRSKMNKADLVEAVSEHT